MLGLTGVDLFFVLSAFLISTILLQSKHGDWKEVQRFYVRRLLRIFPLYYGYLVLASFIGAGVSWWFWVYLQNFPISFGFDGLRGPNHFWSLAVEEQFYLVWPFIVIFWPRRWLPEAMWGTIAISTLARVLIIHTSVSPYYLTLTRLDGLAAGGLLAFYLKRGTLASARTYFAWGGPIFLMMLVAGAKASQGHGLAWVQVTKFSAASGLYACVIGRAVTSKGSIVLRSLASRPLRAIGRVSYGLYIFHPLVLGFFTVRLQSVPLSIKFLLYCLLSYAVAAASFYGFEKRFTDLKQRLAPEPKFLDVQP